MTLQVAVAAFYSTAGQWQATIGGEPGDINWSAGDGDKGI